MSMQTARVRLALETILPAEVAKDLLNNFKQLRADVATGTLGRSSPGKFVETIAQALQHLEGGTYEKKPDIEGYFRNLESRPSKLPDDLRLCAARIARTMYTLRNKRNIAHKADVDPNMIDLRYLLAAAQWLLSEFVRHCTRLSMEDAAQLVEEIQVPVAEVVEIFGDRRIVVADVSVREELLVLMHNSYPNLSPIENLVKSMNRRRPDTVRKALRQLWKEKVAEGSTIEGYRLTRKGYMEAVSVLSHLSV
jgi:hypothetical protein